MRPVLILLLLGASGCSRAIEVEKALEIVDVNTGWYDAGIVEGQKNKLVPSISLKLQNVSPEPVRSVQIVAIFRRISEPEIAWGEHFVRAIGPDGLAPATPTPLIVLRSNLGYTAEQPRMQMLQNREFVDAKVDIFARQGSRALVKLAEYQIARQLLTE